MWRLYEKNSDKERQISYDIAYMWNLKKVIQMNLFIKKIAGYRLKGQLMLTRHEVWEEWIDWDFGIFTYTLLYLKLLCSTKNSAQYL